LALRADKAELSNHQSPITNHQSPVAASSCLPNVPASVAGASQL
jgi:hypothetical protein